MSVSNPVSAVQPADFCFDAAHLAAAERMIAKYPPARQASAVIPLLDLAQRQHGGWLPRAAMEYVARFLDMPTIKVYEVASFYSMFNLKPVGRHFVQVCTTTPCWLRGSDAVLAACKAHLGIGAGETSADGAFSLAEVECLGACANAPTMQIGDDYYEDLDAQAVERILTALKRGEKPKAGSQNGRQGSCPQGGPTTLAAFGPAAGTGFGSEQGAG